MLKKSFYFSITRTSAIILLALCCGCGTLRHAAVSEIGEAFANKQTMLVISSDNDPDLIWDAMPVALKTMEVMLAQDPMNQELCLSCAQGYILYASGYLAQQAQFLENTDFKKAKHLRKRAHNLSLRGRDYALRALDMRYFDFSKDIKDKTKETLAKTTIEDAPFLYWTALGWAIAISTDMSDMDNIAEMPVIEAMMRRVLELDPTYNDGAVYEFFIAYEGGRSEASGGSLANAKKYFQKAVKLTKGKKAFPYVTYAETIAVRKQNLLLFNKLLDEALAIDVNGVKKWRLVNTIAHERALWLKSQTPELFVNYENNNDK